jgi:hypothetical protein
MAVLTAGVVERAAVALRVGMALTMHVPTTLAMLAGTANGATTSTLTPLDVALARAFPGARIEARSLALSAADVKAVERRARARCEARLVTAYVAWHGDTLAGAAYTDRRVVRTREALLMTSIAPDTTVSRIDVLAFFEPADYRPTERWLARFAGAGANAPLSPGRDVPPLAGASLTSRAVSESARLALAWHALLLAPELARRRDLGSAPEARKAAEPTP